MKYFKLTLLLLTVFTLTNCTSDPDNVGSDPQIPGTGITIASIATTDVSDITFTTAISGGIITSDGGSPILDKGIVWSLNENPTTVLGTKTNEGTGIEAFSSNMVNLESNKTYYVRAYARNGKGIAYGNQIEFQTPLDENLLPRVATTIATEVTTNSAKTGGNVTANGFAPVTARGVVWTLDPDVPPTTDINLGITTNGSGIGPYVDILSNLTPNTTYHLRAYAKSSYGTGYGEIVTFTTSPLLYTVGIGVTDINGTAYNSVILNGQEWTTKNLSVTKYRNGDVIPQVQDATQWAALTTGAWCYYSYQTSNGTVYGKLYNWYAVNDPRGLAPTGWHIPTNSEWISLIDFLGGSQEAGGLLKEAGTSHWQSPNTNATNSSGITALPGGYCMANGSFSSLGTIGYWWVADSYNSTNAWCAGLYHNTKTISRAPIDKKQGFSVRVVKN
ncbi:fibrobacter succinogenes major paralogous domain-containing protein [Flavobacterium capsici]|uniref:Fibrobacter succinogenes major paralogous domain-containing protein n=1 Tax=Flavobacterium capsici TaxID=3075618 RepID=A0AA96F3K4_9FLAO|nr:MULTISPECIES: fibrobacter succinogenes major paralogous domain-containing protein [unclassified Flavobacterium]WNM19382.1 fibrobacter succinogenes major paralogous domain-containing protein [Flavobacterium sp. PMR2A8]WNM20771.1 fibrobacter succinogenes major paralogous domain-containing protein [Flavobacterium sp. PMTSA4]